MDDYVRRLVDNFFRIRRKIIFSDRQYIPQSPRLNFHATAPPGRVTAFQRSIY